jgi:hypothetical protein
MMKKKLKPSKAGIVLGIDKLKSRPLKPEIFEKYNPDHCLDLLEYSKVGHKIQTKDGELYPYQKEFLDKIEKMAEDPNFKLRIKWR